MTWKIVIPNVFTAANLLCGFIAIAFVLTGQDLHLAFYLILAAAAFDLLDGLLARLLKAESSFGKEFDSIADFMSFGVSPAILLWYCGFYLSNFQTLSEIIMHSAPALIYVLAVAIRLACFNADSSQAVNFKGLASPAAGILVYSLLVYLPKINIFDNEYLFLLLIAILSAAMMLIPIKVASLKFNKAKRNLVFSLIMLLLVIASILFRGMLAIPALIIAYYILGILFMFLFKEDKNQLIETQK